MTDLVEFLRARLDEDEAAAKTCAEMFPPPWEVADRGWRVRIYSAEVPDAGDHAEPGDMRAPCVIEVEPTLHHDDTHWLSERVDHIARHDPARVLADVEAKRWIVELCNERLWRDDSLGPDYLSDVTLRLFALPYAGHPDYRPEWRPS